VPAAEVWGCRGGSRANLALGNGFLGTVVPKIADRPVGINEIVGVTAAYIPSVFAVFSNVGIHPCTAASPGYGRARHPLRRTRQVAP